MDLDGDPLLFRLVVPVIDRGRVVIERDVNRFLALVGVRLCGPDP